MSREEFDMGVPRGELSPNHPPEKVQINFQVLAGQCAHFEYGWPERMVKAR